MWMTRVKRPGYDGLGPDEPWQVEESGLMTPEDYDTILEVGWPAFQAQLPERARPRRASSRSSSRSSRGHVVIEQVERRRHAVPLRRR